jgi:hypothetical protein
VGAGIVAALRCNSSSEAITRSSLLLSLYNSCIALSEYIAMLADRNFHFGSRLPIMIHPFLIFSPPKYNLLFWEPSLAQPSGNFALPGKSKDGKLLLFSDFHKHLSGPHCVVPSFAAATYPKTNCADMTRCRLTQTAGFFFLRILGSLLYYMGMEHISDHDLERYHLGMIGDEAELAPLEEHLLGCPRCVERAEEAAAYVDTLRAAIITGNFDLE